MLFVSDGNQKKLERNVIESENLDSKNFKIKLNIIRLFYVVVRHLGSP